MIAKQLLRHCALEESHPARRRKVLDALRTRNTFLPGPDGSNNLQGDSEPCPIRRGVDWVKSERASEIKKTGWHGVYPTTRYSCAVWVSSFPYAIHSQF